MDNATPQPSESFMASKKVLIVLGLSAALGVAGVATLRNSVSSNVMTDLSGIDETNLAQWQGTTKQKTSWMKFGKPPTLTSLDQSLWKECSAYTVQEKAELDAYATYWGTRLGVDQPLMEHIEHMVDEHGMPNFMKKGKSMKELFGCTYYSAGLSGPINGIQPDSAEFKTFMHTHGLKKDAVEDYDGDYENTDDGGQGYSGSCTFTSTYWGCDLSWDYTVTIISTGDIDFSLVSEATFDFTLDIANCDVGADIGGAVYLAFSYSSWVYDFEATYNIWESPSLEASNQEVGLEFSYSVFTLAVDFANTVYASTGYGCCFNIWTASISPGVDITIWSDSVEISLGDWTLWDSDDTQCS